MALHSSRRAQDHCVIFSIDGSNHRFDGGIERSLVSKDSQYDSCLDHQRAGTQELIACSRLKIWSGTARGRWYRATGGRTLGFKARGASRQVRMRGAAGFVDDLKVSPFLKALLGSKCTLCLQTDPLQTIEIATNACALRAHHPPRLALKSLRFFPDVTRECYHSVPA